MNRHDGIGMAARELFRDGAAPVATMRSELLIAKHVGHQSRPEIIDVKDRSGFLGLSEKP